MYYKMSNEDTLNEDEYYEYDDYDTCYECEGYDNNYFINEDGELECACFDCPFGALDNDRWDY